MPLFRFLLITTLVLTVEAVQAQTSGGGVYTAPGKPLHVQRGAPAPYTPAKPPTILARYWTIPDSVQRAAGFRQLYLFMGQHLQYPLTALRESEGWAFPSGRFEFQVVINADGSTQPPTLIKRNLTLAESAYKPGTVHALEAEGKRVLSKLQFAPANKPDTIRLPITFPQF